MFMSLAGAEQLGKSILAQNARQAMPKSDEESLAFLAAEAQNFEPDHLSESEDFSEQDFAHLFNLIKDLRVAHAEGKTLPIVTCDRYAELLSRAYLQLKNWE